MNSMNTWLKNNFMALLITFIGVFSSSLMVSFRVEALEKKDVVIEKQVMESRHDILKLDEQQDGTNSLLVGMARDIQYIKERISNK